MPSRALKQFMRKTYRSKTEPRIYYRDIIPGLKTTPGRIEIEGHIIRERQRRKKRMMRRKV